MGPTLSQSFGSGDQTYRTTLVEVLAPLAIVFCNAQLATLTDIKVLLRRE